MNTNMNRRNSYVFKPLVSSSNYLKLTRARNNNEMDATDNYGNKISGLTKKNNSKYNSLNKLTYIMITKIPTIVCGESLD